MMDKEEPLRQKKTRFVEEERIVRAVEDRRPSKVVGGNDGRL